VPRTPKRKRQAKPAHASEANAAGGKGETLEPSEAQRMAATVAAVLEPHRHAHARVVAALAGLDQNRIRTATELAARTVPAMAQAMRNMPLIAQQMKAPQDFFSSFTRPYRERAERAERALAERKKVNRERLRADGKKGVKTRQENAEKRRKKVVDLWNKMTRLHPRNRATKIAKKLRVSQRTVRYDLEAAGIRK
jgi:hypothetical protein